MSFLSYRDYYLLYFRNSIESLEVNAQYRSRSQCTDTFLSIIRCKELHINEMELEKF